MRMRVRMYEYTLPQGASWSPGDSSTHTYAHLIFSLRYEGVVFKAKPWRFRGLCKVPGSLVHIYIHTYAHISVLPIDIRNADGELTTHEGVGVSSLEIFLLEIVWKVQMSFLYGFGHFVQFQTINYLLVNWYLIPPWCRAFAKIFFIYVCRYFIHFAEKNS